MILERTTEIHRLRGLIENLELKCHGLEDECKHHKHEYEEECKKYQDILVKKQK